jgi:hypothetical protein
VKNELTLGFHHRCRWGYHSLFHNFFHSDDSYFFRFLILYLGLYFFYQGLFLCLLDNWLRDYFSETKGET